MTENFVVFDGKLRPIAPCIGYILVFMGNTNILEKYLAVQFLVG